MGVWGPGVFGNDWTADFASEFEHTEPDKRVDLLRHTLVQTPDAEMDELEEFAGAAVAAAAIVAATLPGGPPLGAGGPAGVDESLVVPADLVPVALRAFDRVIADEPEYAQMWDDPTFGPPLAAVRQALSDAVPNT